MTAFVLLNANVRITDFQDAVQDISTFIMSATLNYEAELVEDTSMEGDGTRSRLVGLRDWSLDLTLKQDFVADGPDDVLWDLIFNGAKKLIQVAANGDTISATNPRYHGLAVLQNYTPLAGSVGELSTTPANFMAGGPLTRAVTAWTA